MKKSYVAIKYKNTLKNHNKG